MGELPAASFFAEAADASLDFAAITDHAEAVSYAPAGADGPSLPVWSSTAAQVQAAQGGPVLPLQGYEWTAYQPLGADGRGKGSHRTVLFSAPTDCADLRIPGRPLPEEGFGHDLGPALYLPDPKAVVVDDPPHLWRALDAGVAACDPDLRWLSFAHHPAYIIPQQNDWRIPENAPDREVLVEIYSEHGSSECWDPAAPGCDFALNLDNGHYPDGAVQTALQQGFRLGFVAGTDGHDARPGSLADGPSAVAHWEDTDGDGVLDAPMVQFAPGGLTGVGLPAGEALTEDALFDALLARRTLATTGPRPRLRALARGADGIDRPPGALLPADALPATLIVEVLDEDTGPLTIEQVSASGAVLASAAGPRLQARWAPDGAAATYVRLRYSPAGEAEDRVWISPWFASAPAETGRCGCVTSPFVELSPFPILAALIARRRRGYVNPN